jgi:hypothetical protein
LPLMNWTCFCHNLCLVGSILAFPPHVCWPSSHLAVDTGVDVATCYGG